MPSITKSHISTVFIRENLFKDFALRLSYSTMKYDID